MPVYEYACMECEGHFEELVRMGGEDPACPHCGATHVLRQLSAFAVHGGGHASEARFDAPSPRAGGGCCGGSCGCA